MSYKPTAGMKTEAQRGLDWRSEHGRGGTEVGIARARDIINDKNLSEETVKRMYSYFSRHEVDKEAEGFRPGEDGYPSNGRIAWALWGGDAGFAWSKKIVDKLDRSMDEEVEARPYPNEHAARLRDPDEFSDFRREKDAGGPGIDFIYGLYVEEGNVRADLQSVRFDAERYTVEQAKAWLDGNDFDVIEFEEATGERMNEDRLDKSEVIHRSVDSRAKVIDEKSRVVQMAISSEAPVERYFGMEVIDHTEGAIDMEFISSGRAPLLLDHDPSQQIGVIERVSLDSTARRLRAEVRFGKSALAEEVFNDVVDGIRGNVSIGYRINSMEADHSRDDGTYYRVQITPLEVSIVSIPADSSVGIGRSATVENTSEEKLMKTEEVRENVAVEEPAAEGVKVEEKQEEQRSEPAAADPKPVEAPAVRTVDYQKEAKEILAMAKAHGKRDLADKAIAEGASAEEFRKELLGALEQKSIKSVEVKNMEVQEKEVQNYSLMRLMSALSTGDWRHAGLEREVSDEIAHKMGRSAAGAFVPTNIAWKRDMTVGTAGSGGYLKGTEHMGNEFYEALQARFPLTQYGAQMMSGLTSDVAIPGLGSGAAVGFVAEGGAVSEQTPTTKQVLLQPKTMGAYVDVSRKLMKQSDPSVEAVLRQDIIRRMANKLYQVALEGGGTNEPSGIIANADTNVVSIGANGGALTYSHIVDLLKEVDLQNALDGSLAFVATPGVMAKLRTTPRQASGVEGNFILEPGNQIFGYDVASTTLMPSDLTKGTGTNLNALLFGDMSQLILGMFGGLDVVVDQSALATSGGSRFVFLQDVDVGVKHGQSFSVVKDIDLTA